MNRGQGLQCAPIGPKSPQAPQSHYGLTGIAIRPLSLGRAAFLFVKQIC